MPAKYFSSDAEIAFPYPMKNGQFLTTFGRVPSVRLDSFSRLVGKDSDGVIRPVTRTIFYTPSSFPHKCGSKCRNAKGHNCECECGGKYHGIAN